MADYLRCGSREAKAWFERTYGEKSHTLCETLDSIRSNYGLELFLNIAVPVRTFTKAEAKNVNEIMTKEAEFLDYALGRVPCGSKTATCKSRHLAKDLCLLALLQAGFKDEYGRLMSVNSFCKMLGWRRLDDRVFTSEAKVEQFEGEIDNWTEDESRKLLKSTYARIKQKI